MIKDIQAVQQELEYQFIGEVPQVDKKAALLYKNDPEKARYYITKYSVKKGEETFNRWKKLGEFLIWKHLDGNMKDENGHVTHPGYPEEWYRRIVKEDGELYKMKTLKSEAERNFKDAVAEGDGFFKKGEFEKAKKAYETALSIEKDAPYPKKKITEIDKLVKTIKEMVGKIEFKEN